MTREMSSPSIARGLTTALLPLCLGLAGVPAAQAQIPMRPQPQVSPINFPSRGVVCDSAGQVCYDHQGISLGLTRNIYGPRAERDLINQFQNQPMPREFRLSDGSVCSVQARTCWSDGWSRRTINTSLTTQLFGANAQVISKENGYCRLDEWGMRKYNGRCRLIRSVGNAPFMGSTYTVRLSNQQDLVFGNRNGYLTVFSDGRNWPVQFQNLSSSAALFRWGTKQLVVNTISYGAGDTYVTPPLPPMYNTPYRNTYSGSGINWNGGLEGLLNGLFR